MSFIFNQPLKILPSSSSSGQKFRPRNNLFRPEDSVRLVASP